MISSFLIGKGEEQNLHLLTSGEAGCGVLEQAGECHTICPIKIIYISKYDSLKLLFFILGAFRVVLFN